MYFERRQDTDRSRLNIGWELALGVACQTREEFLDQQRDRSLPHARQSSTLLEKLIKQAAHGGLHASFYGSHYRPIVRKSRESLHLVVSVGE